MSAVKLEPVLCACSWRGTLMHTADCPACARGYRDRMTSARLAILRAMARGERPTIVGTMRHWLRDHRLIVAGPAAPRRPWRITELGARVVAASGVAVAASSAAVREGAAACAP